MSTLVSNARWKLGPQLGCCGIGTVSRLRANYPTAARIRESLRKWEEQDQPYFLSQMKREDRMDEIIKTMDKQPWAGVQPSLYRYELPTNYFAATALPVEIVFAAILERMITIDCYGIWFLSDNMTELGDVHLGAFATRFFVDWMVQQNLGTMQTTGPIVSRRTGNNIQGWMVTLNWPNCVAQIHRARTELHLLIKEFNSNEHIKSKGQATIKTYEQERKAFARELCAGWTE